jgi:starch-binding outer membrane protein, SusD/RagB family
MRKYIFITLPLLLCLLYGCQKAFLETKPDKALLVPTTLADFRTLLDNLLVFNKSPGLTGIADGDFTTTDAGYRGWSLDQERNSYIWAEDIYGTQSASEWNEAFAQIFYANVVLDGLNQVNEAENAAEYRAIKGTALFNRAWVYYGLLQLFAPPYRSATAGTDLGLPIRTRADVTDLAQRSSVEETYRQVITDLEQARFLVPTAVSYKSRPTLPAVYALLSRVYLMRGEYSRSASYADSALALSPALLDYNTLTASATRPMPRALPYGNEEVLFYSAASSYTFTGSSAVAYLDPALFASYANNDLRKTCLFRDNGQGRINFKGSYTGVIPWFGGLATDEIYLIRAECRARTGNVPGAMADLNALLLKRWKTGTFVPMTAATADAALALVLTERRKELVGRNMRWADLRRLNLEESRRVSLSRVINGVTYTLEPGSKRYVYPIPPEEVRLSGITPNER